MSMLPFAVLTDMLKAIKMADAAVAVMQRHLTLMCSWPLYLQSMMKLELWLN
jgi:hypothetical protein